jgi:hypothetical protein
MGVFRLLCNIGVDCRLWVRISLLGACMGALSTQITSLQAAVRD